MALDYEFAPIDVSIATHPKAFKAGVEAMGLWLWGQVHAKEHRTGGRLTRAAVFGAWGGRRNVVLAQRLVTAGLWILRDDGDWDIHNFDKKGPGQRKASRSSSADRMARKRERDASPASVTSSQSDASQVTVTSTSVSSSVSNSSDPDLASPPDWWVGSCDAAAMAAMGECNDRLARWVEYVGSRHRKRWAIGHVDAVTWLTAVLRSEREKRSSRPGPRAAQPVQSGEGRCWLVPSELEM